MTKTVTFNFSNPALTAPKAQTVSINEQKVDSPAAQRSMQEIDKLMGAYFERLKTQNSAQYERFKKCPKLTVSITLPKEGQSWSMHIANEAASDKLAKDQDLWEMKVPLKPETAAKLALDDLIQPTTSAPEKAPAPVLTSLTVEPPKPSALTSMRTPEKIPVPAPVPARIFISEPPKPSQLAPKSSSTSWFSGLGLGKIFSSSKSTKSLPVQEKSLPVAAPQPLFVDNIRSLTNHGNTCFINAVLQALMNTPEIIPALIEAHQKKIARTEAIMPSLFISDEPEYWKLYYSNEASKKLIQAIVSYNDPSETMVDLTPLRGFLEGGYKLFEGYSTTQEDACELLDKILEPLVDLLSHPEDTLPQISDALKTMTFKFGEEKKLTPYTLSEKEAKEFEKHTASSDLPANSTLESLSSSAIVRVSVPGQKVKLQDLLNSELSFSKPAIQDDPCSYKHAGQPGWYRASEKKLTIKTDGNPPEFLTLQLKRFGNRGRFVSKTTTEIEMPENSRVTLIVNGQEVTYEIQTLLMHEGLTPRGGHYFSYVRKDKGWIDANDESVSPMKTLPPTTSSQVYMIFLKKV